MARLSKSALLNRVTSALDDGEWHYIVLSSEHPFRLRIFRNAEAFTVRLYIWNITHGGGAMRAANEYRIQITSGVTQFDTAGVDKTIVLGWWDEVGVFGGWDVSKHLDELGASPSLQIHREAMDAALRDRVATQLKSNDEIAVAFVPSFLGEYLQQLSQLHGLATSATDLRILAEVAAAPDEADQIAAQATSEQRRVVLAQVGRKLRDASFKDRVLVAYQSRCCICSVQLKLVEAAHIVPVAAANNDATSNGLALCALHHRAFDRALLTILPDYRVALNPKRVADLRRLELHGGLPGFRHALRPTIHLPPSSSDRPGAALITEANSLRGWEGFDIVA